MEYKKSRWENEYDKYNENKDVLKSKMAEIRREQATLKEGPEYAAKKKELDELKKTQVKYDKIEKNQAKIEHILNLKKDLVNKTSELLDEKAEFDKINETIEKCEKVFEKLDKERDALLKDVQKIDVQLKDPNLKDEDRKKLEDERKSKIASVSDNNTKYSEVANKKDDLSKKVELFDKDKINEELLKNEKLISKCDLIGANLVKGKGMEEISAKLENFEFKPNKDFAKKIQEMRDTYNKEKSQDNKEPEEKQEEDKNKEKETESKEGQEKTDDNEVEEKGQEEEEKPVPVSEFEQNHPRLAQALNFLKNKIGTPVADFFKNTYATVANKVSNIIHKETGEKEEEKDTETIHDDNEKPVEEKTTEPEKSPEPVVEPIIDVDETDKDFEYAMKHLSGKDQDKVLEEIAEKGTSGFRESVKVSNQERLAKMKKQSANAYAEKYGGKYATQDGANLENDDKDR